MAVLKALVFINVLLVFNSVIFCQKLPFESTKLDFLNALTLKSLGSDCDDEKNPCNIENAKCKNKKCECRTGYVNDESETKCLKVATSYYDTCDEDSQCAKFLSPGGECLNSKCICGELYHYLHGRCHLTKDLNDECINDENCYDGSEYQATSCTKDESKCQCNEGFYQRGWTGCRRQMKEVGDECIIDQDCDLENGTCVSHKCVKDGKFIQINQTSIASHTLIKNGGIKIGDQCKSKDECQSIKNAICDVDGKCICERAHFPSQDNIGCIPEIGETCNPQSKVDFQVEHSVCREDMWTCPIDRIVTKDNRQCVELTEKISKFCKLEEQCNLFGSLSKCLNGRCWCDEEKAHYVRDDRFCWLNHKIGDKCSRNEECYTQYTDYQASCKNEVCTCPMGWYANDGKCLQIKSEVGGYCEIDSNCNTTNSLCNDQKCVCKEHHFELDGECLKGLDAECEIDEDCKSQNTVCPESEHICKCDPDSVPIPVINECLTKSQHNEECEHDVQCYAALPNTFCNVTGEVSRCKCTAMYYFKEDQCQLKKWVNDKCTGTDECFTANTQCTSGTCQCLPGYKLVGAECKSSAVTRHLSVVLLFILVGLKFVF